MIESDGKLAPREEPQIEFTKIFKIGVITHTTLIIGMTNGLIF